RSATPPLGRCFPALRRSGGASPLSAARAVLPRSPPLGRCFPALRRSGGASPLSAARAVLPRSPPLGRCFPALRRSGGASPLSAARAVLPRSPPLGRCFPALRRSGGASPLSAARASPFGELLLHPVEHGYRTGVDAGVEREVQRGEVADEHEVEQLRQRALALGADLLDGAHDLFEHLVDELEAPHHLGMLEVVAQMDGAQHLAGDVAVLAPPAQLV